MPDDEQSYELEVDLVACQSRGGAYDDDAFCAGFTAGQVWEELRSGGPMVNRPVRSELVRQLDVLAMAHGATVEVVEVGDEWVTLGFHPRRSA